jgi:hypothetical protein
MKIPMTLTFKKADGTFITQDDLPPTEDGKNIVTLRDVLIVALTTEFPEDQRDVANIMTEKLKRFAAYQLVMDSVPGDLELMVPPDFVAYVKPRIARCFGLLIFGPACVAMDGGK